MEPTDNELLTWALTEAERLVINEAVYRALNNTNTEMLDLAVKELIIVRRKLTNSTVHLTG